MPPEEKIDLDLETILGFLQGRQEMYRLQTVLRKSPPELGVKGACTVTLHLLQGRVIACHFSVQSQQFSGVELMRLLPRQERLSWSFAPVSEAQEQPNTPPSLPTMPSSARSVVTTAPLAGQEGGSSTAPLAPVYKMVPRRVFLSAQSELLVALPRDLRRVLALVDGERSVEKIAAMLALEREQIVQALYQLRARNLIH